MSNEHICDLELYKNRTNSPLCSLMVMSTKFGDVTASIKARR